MGLWQLHPRHGSEAIEIADLDLLDDPMVVAPMLPDLHETMPVVMFAPAVIAPVMPSHMRAIVRGDDEAGGLRRGNVDGGQHRDKEKCAEKSGFHFESSIVNKVLCKESGAPARHSAALWSVAWADRAGTEDRAC